METVRVEADSARLTSALERILPQCGYRTLRSFDLPLVAAAQPTQSCCACAEYGKEPCNCRYAVLLVFTDPAVAGPPAAISIQGQGKCSIVTLLSFERDSALAAQFAMLLMEAIRNAGSL